MSKDRENLLIVGMVLTVSALVIFILGLAYGNSPITQKIVHKDYKVTVDDFVYSNDTLIFNNIEHHHVRYVSYSNATGTLSYSTYYKDTSESDHIMTILEVIAFILLVIGVVVLMVAPRE